MAADLGIYIHIPFCRSLCAYCDFYKLRLDRRDPLAAFLGALKREIAGCAAQIPPGERGVDTVFLGGGTPSLVSPPEVADLLAALGRHFRLDPDAEVTLEANPELPSPWLRGYLRSGVNRISLGFQTIDDRLLGRLGRRHHAAQAMDRFREARAAGFRNVNLDLLAGIPGQEADRWEAELEAVLSLRPDHLSVYLLETDKETPLARGIREGLVDLPPEETTVEIYHRTRDLLLRRGYEHYEISNFCLPGRRCRHNLRYWTDRPFLGMGPGAHGYFRGRRYRHPPDLQAYLDRPVPELPRPGGMAAEDRRARAAEAAIFGLRLLEGLDLSAIDSRYGVGLAAECRPALGPLLEAGLLVREGGGRFRLTGRGLLLSNEVFQAFLPGSPPAASPRFA